jgi:hypothetical protein
MKGYLSYTEESGLDPEEDRPNLPGRRQARIRRKDIMDQMRPTRIRRKATMDSDEADLISPKGFRPGSGGRPPWYRWKAGLVPRKTTIDPKKGRSKPKGGSQNPRKATMETY